MVPTLPYLYPYEVTSSHPCHHLTILVLHLRPKQVWSPQSNPVVVTLLKWQVEQAPPTTPFFPTLRVGSICATCTNFLHAIHFDQPRSIPIHYTICTMSGYNLSGYVLHGYGYYACTIPNPQTRYTKLATGSALLRPTSLSVLRQPLPLSRGHV